MVLVLWKFDIWFAKKTDDKYNRLQKILEFIKNNANATSIKDYIVSCRKEVELPVHFSLNLHTFANSLQISSHGQDLISKQQYFFGYSGMHSMVNSICRNKDRTAIFKSAAICRFTVYDIRIDDFSVL